MHNMYVNSALTFMCWWVWRWRAQMLLRLRAGVPACRAAPNGRNSLRTTAFLRGSLAVRSMASAVERTAPVGYAAKPTRAHSPVNAQSLRSVHARSFAPPPARDARIEKVRNVTLCTLALY